jgi:hypothetical protein
LLQAQKEGPDMAQHVRAFGVAPGPPQGFSGYLPETIGLPGLGQSVAGRWQDKGIDGGQLLSIMPRLGSEKRPQLLFGLISRCEFSKPADQPK